MNPYIQKLYEAALTNSDTKIIGYGRSNYRIRVSLVRHGWLHYTSLYFYDRGPDHYR